MRAINFRSPTSFLVSALLLFALWNTGLATDDFGFLAAALERDLRPVWLPGIYISVPVLHYTHALAYFVFGESLWAYSVLKWIYLLFALYASARFLNIYFPPMRATLGALIFTLSPLHDGATIWLTGQYLILSFGCFFLAFVKTREQENSQAVLFALLGSFSSYGSPPIAAGLALICLIEKRWRAAAVLLVPNLVYCAYYIYTSAFLHTGISRLPAEFRITSVIKAYAVQTVSFVDAGIGPSAWLKFGLAMSSIGWISALFASVAAVYLWRSRTQLQDASFVTANALVAGCVAIMLLAFGIFALTGSYPQIAFNLGDRVTIYGNFLVASLFARYASRSVLTAAAIFTITAFLGLCDHWSAWHQATQASAARIRAIDVPAAVPLGETVFVSGLQYSRLGPMTHIDHFTAGYVVRDAFAAVRHGKPPIKTASFNRRLQLKGDALVDTKYGDRHEIGDTILLYDAETGALNRIAKAEIGSRLAHLPAELRHWTQLVATGRMRELILWLMPSLAYAYPAPA